MVMSFPTMSKLAVTIWLGAMEMPIVEAVIPVKIRDCVMSSAWSSIEKNLGVVPTLQMFVENEDNIADSISGSKVPLRRSTAIEPAVERLP